MPDPDPAFLVVGYVRRVHGNRGELVVEPLTDHPESTFASGVVVRLAREDTDRPDPALPTLEVGAARPFKKGYLVRFEGLEGRGEAEFFRGVYLLREARELEPLEEGEFHYHQLLGMEVVTVQGEALGTVSEVYPVEPADLLEVRGERTRYIPLSSSVVREVDMEGRRIVLDPPEGLLDL